MTEAGTIETFALKNNLSRIIHGPISTFSDSMVGLGELKQMNAFRCVDDSDIELTDEEELAA